MERGQLVLIPTITPHHGKPVVVFQPFSFLLCLRPIEPNHGMQELLMPLISVKLDHSKLATSHCMIPSPTMLLNIDH